MKLCLQLAILAGACCWQAAGQESEFAAGRRYYAAGDFKKSAAHFEAATKAEPQDAAASYWTGRSNEMQAAIAVPFNAKYTAKARIYLEKAVQLAPGRPEYRLELFDFLLDSAWLSVSSLRQAEAMVRTTSEDDPCYLEMRRRLEEERQSDSSVGGRLAKLILGSPRAAVGALSSVR